MFTLIFLSLAIVVDCFPGFTVKKGVMNVALGKPASQSSNYNSVKWFAPVGVDGNVGNNEIHQDSCFHTEVEYQPWWRVDLQQIYNITAVVIHNRLDCCDKRARNISLTIGELFGAMDQVSYLDGNFYATHTFSIDPPVIGRYVQMQLMGITEAFHLCEVEVLAFPTGTSNVALGKPASQSSNYTADKWFAPVGVDGNLGNNDINQDSCFHTKIEYQPWWRVDLQQDYYIAGVILYNRLDCCDERARNISLTIGQSTGAMGQVGHLDGNFNATHTFFVDPSVKGRYVHIQLMGITEAFHLCDVEVMAYFAGTSNVALGKPASQSSNYTADKWFAPVGVDGNLGNNDINQDSCFHTDVEYQPWWRVDLQQDYYISGVVVHNRLDCCDDRARNISLTIGESLGAMDQVGYQDGNFNAIYMFFVDPPVKGRYVQMQLMGITEAFHLCEVEVMADPAVSNVALGKRCTMSSTKWHASNGVDGIIGDYIFKNSKKKCFHTKDKNKPWWRVDLGQNHKIVSVTMHNPERAKNVTLTTGTTLSNMVQSGYLNGGFNETHTFVIYPAVIARYVQLQLTDISEYFHLCEVEVLGSPYPSLNCIF
ncbi:FUCL7-like protein [Mya arenaria]|uniref:FUCL7-like protein n=1 Tax=Mya arenaria TaxID=6604 RepID=A0ABY7DJ61_MYAAR|nr:FUCL7-like protein [Mya arenaria]